MVDEALVSYLSAKVPAISETKLQALFKPDDNITELSPSERMALVKAIGSVKILDPACGSGAFPMGALHKLVDLLQKLDPNNEGWKRDRLEEAEKEFNMAFKAVLPDVVKKASELLEYFTGYYMKINLEFGEIVYDKTRRKIQNQALHLSVEFNGQPLTNHQTILNEVRLSSLALALFLASILLSNPAPGSGITSPLNILVMDDVLISLDLSNRLPLPN